MRMIGDDVGLNTFIPDNHNTFYLRVTLQDDKIDLKESQKTLDT